ncbi:LysR substrate-binding domain-containing protein, partial [Spirillospora sp. NPDC049652]
KAEAAAASGEVRGTIAIGAIPTVTAVDLPGVLERFHARHPRVRISLRSGASEEMVERVRVGTLDVAFLGIPVSARPKGVHGRDLARGELVAVMAPGHPLADQDRVELRDLADEPFVDFPPGSAARAQTDEAFAAAGVRREVGFEISSVDFMTRLIRQGLGIGLMPAAFVTELTDLAVLPIRDAPARLEHLVWGRFPLSPATTAFLTELGIPLTEGD